jgi:hypothetical protein
MLGMLSATPSELKQPLVGFADAENRQHELSLGHPVAVIVGSAVVSKCLGLPTDARKVHRPQPLIMYFCLSFDGAVTVRLCSFGR